METRMFADGRAATLRGPFLYVLRIALEPLDPE